MNNLSVGDTPIRHIPAVSEALGHTQLYIKDESVNPSGTWKDRRSIEALKIARRSGRNHLCLISAGNGAQSVAKLAEGTSTRVTAIIGQKVDPLIWEQLQQAGIRVVQTKLDRSLSCTQIQALAKANEADNPFDITNYFHMAYTKIFAEIVAGLEPDYIVAPYGTGEALFGITLANNHRYSKERRRKVKIIGAKPAEEISYADKLTGKFGPYPAFLEDHHDSVETVRLSEQEIIDTYQQISPHVRMEPSAAAAFAAVRQINAKPYQKIVVINSGRGIF